MSIADSVIQYVSFGEKITNVIKARKETYHKLKIKRKELIHSKRISKNCDTITTMYCMFKGNVISKMRIFYVNMAENSLRLLSPTFQASQKTNKQNLWS